MKWERKGREFLWSLCGGTWRQYRVQARDEAGGRAEHMVTPRRGKGEAFEILKGVGQTEGMVIPRCAASATWNPHVDVKGGSTQQGGGCGSVDWVEVEGAGKRMMKWETKVQARDEVGGGRAEHMVTPRRAASATWNPQCEEGAGRG